MKLKVLLQSQRDARWSSTILGYNTNSVYNIYSYGCLIASLGNYIDKTPAEINQILKEHNGFTSGGGNFIWGKCTTLGLTQTYASTKYTSPASSQAITAIKESINNGYPCLAEVDFNPATVSEEMHFVLLAGVDDVGNILVVDPWEGQWETWSEDACKRNIYQYRTYDKKLDIGDGQDLQAQLDQCRLERDRNWNWFVRVCEALKVGANVEAAENLAKSLVENDTALVLKDKALQEAQTQITDLKTELTQLQAINAKQAEEVSNLKTEMALQATVMTEKVTLLEKKYQESTQNYEDALTKIHILQGTINKPVVTGWQKIWEGIVDLLPKAR